MIASREYVKDLLLKVLNKMTTNKANDEIIIGTWIDGKPIYRRVIVPDTTILGNGNYNIGIPIENLFHLSIHATLNNNNNYKFIINTNMSDGKSFVGFDGNNIYWTDGRTSNFKILYFIIEYTKTTD